MSGRGSTVAEGEKQGWKKLTNAGTEKTEGAQRNPRASSLFCVPAVVKFSPREGP